MKTGTLIIEIYGELIEKQSIVALQNIMEQPLLSVSDSFDFDYRRFEYFSAYLIWVVPLTAFWKSDIIYKSLRKGIAKHFNNWKIDITLLLHGAQS